MNLNNYTITLQDLNDFETGNIWLNNIPGVQLDPEYDMLVNNIP